MFKQVYIGLEQHVKIAINTILDTVLATFSTSFIDCINIKEPFCKSDHSIIHGLL